MNAPMKLRLCISFITALVLLCRAAPLAAQQISLLSKAADGNAANGECLHPRISGDGRYVVFRSAAKNLAAVSGAKVQVVWYDREQGQFEIASVSSEAAQADGASDFPVVSDDGNCSLFETGAGNLAPGDVNDRSDVYLRVRSPAGATQRISVPVAGASGFDGASTLPAITPDCAQIFFTSNSQNLIPGLRSGGDVMRDVYAFDRQSGAIELVNSSLAGGAANGDSSYVAVDASGRYAVFDSSATNLTADDTNGRKDIFVRDRQSGATERVSVGAGGAQANNWSWYPGISRDGRFVVFQSHASNLVGGDLNATQDIFVYDREARTTERVSVSSSGQEADDASQYPDISGDGRYVVFESAAKNLVAGMPLRTQNIFVHDRETTQTKRVSVGFDGSDADYESEYPRISADGRFIVFQSAATNLVPGRPAEKVAPLIYVALNPFVEPSSPTPTPLDRTAPLLKVRKISLRAGRSGKISYAVVEQSGRSAETIRIVRAGRRVRKMTVRMSRIPAGGRRSVALKMSNLARGKLRYCVRAVDPAGNRSAERCAALVIR